jgi:hypothetical protein
MNRTTRNKQEGVDNRNFAVFVNSTACDRAKSDASGMGILCKVSKCRYIRAVKGDVLLTSTNTAVTLVVTNADRALSDVIKIAKTSFVLDSDTSLWQINFKFPFTINSDSKGDRLVTDIGIEGPDPGKERETPLVAWIDTSPVGKDTSGDFIPFADSRIAPKTDGKTKNVITAVAFYKVGQDVDQSQDNIAEWRGITLCLDPKLIEAELAAKVFSLKSSLNLGM